MYKAYKNTKINYVKGIRALWDRNVSNVLLFLTKRLLCYIVDFVSIKLGYADFQTWFQYTFLEILHFHIKRRANL